MTIDEFIELLNKTRDKHDMGQMPILIDMKDIVAIEFRRIYKQNYEITAFNIISKDTYNTTKSCEDIIS